MNKYLLMRGGTMVLAVIIQMNLAGCDQPAPTSLPTVKTGACPIDSNLPDVPRMWVKSQVSKQNEALYQNLASVLATQVPDGTETVSFFFPVAEFTQMIDYYVNNGNPKYVDVYLMTYGQPGPADIPASLNGKLGFLFAPVNGSTVTHYLLRENAPNFDATNYKLDGATGDNWKQNYLTASKKLNPLLDDGDAANYPTGQSGTPSALSNTKRIRYFLKDLQEIEAEIDFQKTHCNNTVNGIRAFFSSYPLQADGAQMAYGNRIYVQFEFTKDVSGTPAVFYIDTTTDFCKRAHQLPRTEYTISTVKGFDNGALCPPTCN